MNVLTELILGFAKSFDDVTYPPTIYFYLLDRVRDAKTPEALGNALMHLLAWKDAKIREDPKGPHKTLRSAYRVATTKPNTLSARHEHILKSERFFIWAGGVRKSQTFDAALISDLEQQFGLWKTLVLSVFVLHCLRPPIYPIVDRNVMIVFNLFHSHAPLLRADPKRITAKAYEDYHGWWLRLLHEAGIRPLAAETNQLKTFDAGLWSLGKSLASNAKEMLESVEDDLKPASNPVGESLLEKRGTKSPAFRARAIELRGKGHTQAQAIQTAAAEMGITLAGSYLAYPGSHFDRWRKQGHWHRQA